MCVKNSSAVCGQGNVSMPVKDSINHSIEELQEITSVFLKRSIPLFTRVKNDFNRPQYFMQFLQSLLALLGS